MAIFKIDAVLFVAKILFLMHSEYQDIDANCEG